MPPGGNRTGHCACANKESSHEKTFLTSSLWFLVRGCKHLRAWNQEVTGLKPFTNCLATVGDVCCAEDLI